MDMPDSSNLTPYESTVGAVEVAEEPDTPVILATWWLR